MHLAFYLVRDNGYNGKHHTDETILNSNKHIVETGTKLTPITHACIDDSSLF